MEVEDAGHILAAVKAARAVLAGAAEVRVTVSRAEYAYDVSATAREFALEWTHVRELRTAIGDLASVGMVWRPLEGHHHANAHRWWLRVRVPMLQYGPPAELPAHDPWTLDAHPRASEDEDSAACAACVFARGGESRQVGYYPGKRVEARCLPKGGGKTLSATRGSARHKPY